MELSCRRPGGNPTIFRQDNAPRYPQQYPPTGPTRPYRESGLVHWRNHDLPHGARSVSFEANGPDTVHNSLSLSGTAHWMIDSSLISFAMIFRY
jgi:hypothetical protein